VIGVALDGLGFGDDGTLWGGEFLLVDYRSSQRVAMFRPVAMPGGEQAMHEPWRNTLAHLLAAIGWSRFALNFCELELFEFLRHQPRELLAKMIDDNINSPRATSCGRLFDAVAAAAGVCRERALYEGQAAIEFEALLDHDALANEDDELAYPFAISRWQANGLPYIEPAAMWAALLGDLTLNTPVGIISTRFHKGLAIVIARLIDQLSHRADTGEEIRTIALSGGVFQNRVLLEQVVARLRALDFNVLTHRQVPANDGGIALGQAVIAAARAFVH
jgi:hydrogenase maturation protein HypF